MSAGTRRRPARLTAAGLLVLGLALGALAVVLLVGHRAPGRARVLPAPRPAVSTPAPAAVDANAVPGPPPGYDGDLTAPLTPLAPGASGAGAASTSPPARLVVPAIGVSAPVVDLGLQADGTLQVPANTTSVGWYAAGPAPGAVGPALLAGHVDSTRGPGVFYRLRALLPGDKIEVVRADRSTVTFTVDRVQQYEKTAFPTAEVYGATTVPTLRLVTCGGSFDSATGHYLSNVVVYATAG